VFSRASGQGVDHQVDWYGGVVHSIGENVLTENVHMSFLPVDSRWLLSDTYPDSGTHERVVFLHDMHSGQRQDIGSFRVDPALSKENRYDLHPRWRRDGQAVCIDCVHGDGSQICIFDVGAVVGLNL